MDEADGSVTATLGTGTGYTVSSSAGAATAAVSDNDVPELSIASGGNVTEGSDASFTVTASPTPHAAMLVSVTVSATGAFGVATGSQSVTIPTTGSKSFTISTSGDSDWTRPTAPSPRPSRAARGYTVSSSAGSATAAVSDDDVPELSIAADGDVTEGSDASFTVTASPTPHAAMLVSVTVSATGAFGVATGSQSVTIPTTGSKSFTISTSGDAIDEPDGSVTATLASGSGYTVSSSAGAATAAVSDDDDPLPTPTPTPTPTPEEQETSTTCSLPADAVTVAEVTGWRDALDPGKATAGIQALEPRA